jgi:hypothetical protein
MASFADWLRQQTEDNAWEKKAKLKQSLMPSEFQQAATPMTFSVNANPTMLGMQNGQPDYGYGNRYESNQPKGLGYFGEVPRPDGVGISGELGVDFGQGDVPSMTPNLTANELQSILTAKEGQKYPESVYRKAESHANLRRLQGRSPFAGINDKQTLLPSRTGTLLQDYWNR